MTDGIIHHNYYVALLGFLLAAKRHLIAISGEYDLSGIQAATLLLLDETKPQPMKSFCTLYHCDASNVTGIIDGLEKKGLVSRQSDAHDRRIKVIQLEPAGKQLQQTIITRLNEDQGSLFGPLTPTETQDFIYILEKLAASTVPLPCAD